MHNLGLWMTIQSYGEEFWLDEFSFNDVARDTDTSRLLFVDVGDGIGHQFQIGIRHASGSTSRY